MKDWKELLNLEKDEVMDDGMVNLQNNKMNIYIQINALWFRLNIATNTFIFKL